MAVAASVVGAPSGPQGTPSVTAGVIAGLGEIVEVAGQAFYDVISTDAVISPRASGGPLVDRSGAVVGITTRTGGEFGLVIPIDHARKVAEQLISHGRVTYPWLGVHGTDLDPRSAKEHGVSTGTLIHRVTPASPVPHRPPVPVTDRDGRGVARPRGAQARRRSSRCRTSSSTARAHLVPAVAVRCEPGVYRPLHRVSIARDWEQGNRP